MDGVIAGLTTVARRGWQAASLPTVRPSLGGRGKHPQTICDAAYANRHAKYEGRLGRDRKRGGQGAVEPVVNKISDGVAAIWTHYVVEPDRLASETRKTKLEAARWPEFDDIAKK